MRSEVGREHPPLGCNGRQECLPHRNHGVKPFDFAPLDCARGKRDKQIPRFARDDKEEKKHLGGC